MVKRGTLNVPVVGVAKSGWNIHSFAVLSMTKRERFET
jgi:hypothetical protein